MVVLHELARKNNRLCSHRNIKCLLSSLQDSCFFSRLWYCASSRRTVQVQRMHPWMDAAMHRKRRQRRPTHRRLMTPLRQPPRIQCRRGAHSRQRRPIHRSPTIHLRRRRRIRRPPAAPSRRQRLSLNRSHPPIRRRRRQAILRRPPIRQRPRLPCRRPAARVNPICPLPFGLARPFPNQRAIPF